MPTEMLKSEKTSKFTILNDDRADFSQFSRSGAATFGTAAPGATAVGADVVTGGPGRELTDINIHISYAYIYVCIIMYI